MLKKFEASKKSTKPRAISGRRREKKTARSEERMSGKQEGDRAKGKGEKQRARKGKGLEET
jgi:hypothetical protein